MDEDQKAPDRKEIAALGGRARAAKIGPKRASEIAKNAADSRWSGHVHHALDSRMLRRKNWRPPQAPEGIARKRKQLELPLLPPSETMQDEQGK